MQTTGSDWARRMHEAWKRMAEMSRQQREKSHGPFTPNPEPPGEGVGDGWEVAASHLEEFAAAGLCEVWRMDLGAETRFMRLSDFTPGFNITGLWFRKA